ncbi:MAG: hypothetical protein OER92_06450 [Alphaproteobacteria bacterium]|nr:hypothetical protein [Alphaproteobacteria bacterium]
MDWPALVQRIIHPHTHTPEAAWQAAGNSWIAGTILALNRLLFGTVWLSSPAPVGPGLAHLGVGFFYILMALLAYRRSRIASGVILVLAVLEALIEVLFNVLVRGEIGLSFVIAAVALVLAVGGFRGANAIFAHYRNTR